MADNLTLGNASGTITINGNLYLPEQTWGNQWNQQLESWMPLTQISG